LLDDGFGEVAGSHEATSSTPRARLLEATVAQSRNAPEKAEWP
jgi:hypothetical protein